MYGVNTNSNVSLTSIIHNYYFEINTVQHMLDLRAVNIKITSM
jgi:hypothetical protein